MVVGPLCRWQYPVKSVYREQRTGNSEFSSSCRRRQGKRPPGKRCAPDTCEPLGGLSAYGMASIRPFSLDTSDRRGWSAAADAAASLLHIPPGIYGGGWKRPPRSAPRIANRALSVQILLAFADSRLPLRWRPRQGGFRPWGPWVPPPPPSWPGNVAGSLLDEVNALRRGERERRVRRAHACDLLRELPLLKTEYRSRLSVVTPNAVSISKHNGDLKMAPRYICDILAPSRLRVTMLNPQPYPMQILHLSFKTKKRGQFSKTH